MMMQKKRILDENFQSCLNFICSEGLHHSYHLSQKESVCISALFMNVLSEKGCKSGNNSKNTTKQNKNSHFLVKSIFFSYPKKSFIFLKSS